MKSSVQKDNLGTPFVTFPELMRRLSTSRITLNKQIASGVIPFIELPGRKRHLFHWPTIEAILLKHQHERPTPINR
jgi:hypothetical protein